MEANYKKIKGLIHTEKSNRQDGEGKYYLKVDHSCLKKDLKSLLKHAFNVDVKKVNIINVCKKVKKFKGIVGSRKSYKKAIITLKKGQSINFQD